LFDHQDIEKLEWGWKMPNDCCTLKKHKIVTTTHGDGNMYVSCDHIFE
jgi:hypothetical protein